MARVPVRASSRGSLENLKTKRRCLYRELRRTVPTTACWTLGRDLDLLQGIPGEASPGKGSRGVRAVVDKTLVGIKAPPRAKVRERV